MESGKPLVNSVAVFTSAARIALWLPALCALVVLGGLWALSNADVFFDVDVSLLKYSLITFGLVFLSCISYAFKKTFGARAGFAGRYVEGDKWEVERFNRAS